MSNQINVLFIVPNNDGEAIEIQHLLEENKYSYLVTNQQWGASWSNLEPDIKSSILEFNGTVYGIELQGSPLTNSCVNIDHHTYEGDDRSNELSSIEQVANLIGVELSYFQKAVSARDKGHIKLLKEEGFDKDTIELVGSLDRKAQGISEEEEQASLQVCKEVKKYLGPNGYMKHLIIRLPHSRCQTVRDVLYDYYENLLVLSPTEFNFYGDAALCKALHKTFGGWLSGSVETSDHGFAGNSVDKDTVERVLEYYKTLID